MKYSLPKITIVTPVYNGENVIKDLIYSIVDQDYQNWEMIIQDGKSTDKTTEFVGSFNEKKIALFSEKDNGMYDALNKAIKKASGDYIIHLNSDEQLMEGALTEIVAQINKKPNYDVYCFGVVIIDKKRIPRVFRAAYPQKSLFIKLFNLDIMTAGIVYNTDVFRKIKFSTKYKAVSDALLFIELVKTFKVYYSNIYTSFFLIEGKNLSLEDIAFVERESLKSSVLFGNVCYFLLYIPRKIFKLYSNCRIYTGPNELVRIYSKGEKVKKSTSSISHKLMWDKLVQI
jgi:glycosyltransferase involved in cell wall biosynthesis